MKFTMKTKAGKTIVTLNGIGFEFAAIRDALEFIYAVKNMA